MSHSSLKGRIAGSLLTLLMVGCSGPPEANPPSTEIDRARQVQPPPGSQPGAQPGVFNVTITTRSGLIYIDGLELEYNRRRGLHVFPGFTEDNFQKLATIPWEQIQRVDFGQTVGPALWEQIESGRESANLFQSQIFETQIRFKDGRVTLFYAIIPRLRGWQNEQEWSLGMDNNPLGIQYIEFSR